MLYRSQRQTPNHKNATWHRVIERCPVANPLLRVFVLSATLAIAAGFISCPLQAQTGTGTPFAWSHTTSASVPTTTVAPPLSLKHWYTVFSPPQIAAVQSVDTNSVNVNMGWLDSDQLISLVWDSRDTQDHPWFSYSTLADYTHLVWTFTVTLDSHVIPFDQPYGLTLTVEMADGSQQYVRLWNYRIAGTNTSATFRVDFGNIASGWYADTPFGCTNVTRIFFTFVNRQYGSATKFSAYQYATANISTVSATGAQISYGSASVPANHLQMTLDYDNLYHVDPQRVADQIAGLGYTQFATCYIGMSHFFKIGWDSAESRFHYTPDTNPVNQIAMGWLADLYARLKARNITLIFSMSYEMLASYTPAGWSQTNHAGGQALSGWDPPSTFLAFTNPAVISHLKNTAAQLLSIPGPGDPKYFQIGEPWWWDGSYSDGQPCFYDAATQALYQATYGTPMYVFTSSNDPVSDPNAIQTAAFLAAQVGQSTHAIASYLKNVYSNVQVGVLFDVSQAFAGKLTTAVNYPKSYWTYPAFDFFQLEAYDTIVAGNLPLHDSQLQQVMSDLAYPNSVLHYFGGFVMTDDDAVWSNIFTGLDDVSNMGIANLAIWSYTQIVSDGIVVNWTPSTIVNIDSPQSNSAYSGIQTFSGWAFDKITNIATVSVTVDGASAGNAIYGSNRPDVCSTYAISPCSGVGWTFVFDTTSLPNGLHTFTITATTDGSIARQAGMSVYFFAVNTSSVTANPALAPTIAKKDYIRADNKIVAVENHQ